MIIIGILAAVAIPVYLTQKKKAVDSAIKSDLRSIAALVETTAADSQEYPTTPGLKEWTATNTELLAVPGLGEAKVSDGNLIQYRLAEKQGFCLGGSNPKSSALGIDKGHWWYVSATGGLVATPSLKHPTGC